MTQETRHKIVQRAVFAAFGCVKLDYRSPRRLDEAASVVADFVCAELDRAHERSLGQSAAPSDVADVTGPDGSNTIPGARIKPRLMVINGEPVVKDSLITAVGTETGDRT